MAPCTDPDAVLTSFRLLPDELQPDPLPTRKKEV